MSPVHRSIFTRFQKAILLIEMVFFVSLAPSLMGRSIESVAAESVRENREFEGNPSLSAGVAGSAMLQSGGSFSINPSVIAGGGGTSTNGTTRLDGTIGQSVLGLSSGGTFSLAGGFWQSGQQPNAAFTISGTINYCAAASPTGAANTTLTLTGDASAMTSTGAAPSTGAYSFTNLASGSYVVTPTKTGGVSGINTTDVSRILQFLAGSGSLTACQQLAADVSQNAALNTTDATRILNFLAGTGTTSFVGEWRFNPPSRTYISLTADQTLQNFDALLLGEVSGNWIPAAKTSAPVTTLNEAAKGGLEATPSRSGKSSVPDDSSIKPMTACGPPFPTSCGGASVAVTLPTATVIASIGQNFSEPITIGDTTGRGITGFSLRFTFDPSVVQLQAGTPVTTTGTFAGGGGLLTTNTSTPGVLIIVYAQTTSFTGAGTLIKVNFTRMGAQGTSSPLTFQAACGETPPKPDLQLDSEPNDCVVPSTSVNGVLNMGAPTAMTLSSVIAMRYNNGVHVNWQTGFEAENLGFNIYREVEGQRTLVNPDVIAGSALLAGRSTKLQAGQSYGWWDNRPDRDTGVQYWIEEIDLNGLRTMHGPFGVRHVGGRPPRQSHAELLSQVGRGEPRVHQLALDYDPGGTRSIHSQSSTQAVAPKLSAMPALKMTIREEGWYRVTRPELVAAGFDTDTNPRNLQLFVNGVEQPMLVAGEREGRIDSIEFFATGQDETATDAHVYWLVSGDVAGNRIGFVKNEGKSGGVGSFPFTVERRDRTVYFSSLRNGETENFFGQVVTSRPVDQTLTLRHLDNNSSDQAEVEIALQGVTDQFSAPDHSVRVLMNGAQIGTIVFDGQAHKAQKFTISRELLKEGDNVVTLASEVAGSVTLVDYILVTYPHTYASDNDSLRMLVSSESQTISGFSNGTVRVFDITDPSAPIELSGRVSSDGDSYAVTVDMAGQGTRTLLAVTENSIKRPASMVLNEPSNLRSKKNKADMLIIARREFFGALEPLAALRENQGLRVRMVDIVDIFDEFADGEPNPQAIKDFLRFATTTWKKKPSFVLFAGQGSLDPRNHLGFGDTDIVPARLIDTGLMETASDDWFVDFNDDGIPELAVGRLPFRTQSEAATMVSKILSYERSRPANEVLLVSDINDGFDFEAANGLIRETLPSSLTISRIDRGRVEAAAAKSALIDALNHGPKIVNYIGHGSVNLWSGNLFTNDDASGLTNADHLSLFVMMTCLNGYFQDAALDSLAETLLKAEHGGAVAVWTSSGMTGPGGQALINQQLYKLLFGSGGPDGRAPRLGEAVVKAKAATDDPDVRRTWVLLGDPAMRLR